jgi:hypothetical protein
MPNEKLEGACMFCNQELFCSQKCMFDGLAFHFKECEARDQIEKQIKQRDHLTPRSALNKIFVLIEKDPELKMQLFSVFQSCEQQLQEKGCLVIRVHDAEELCTIVNNSLNPSKTIVKLMDFQTCASLLSDKTMKPVLELRLCLMMTNKYVVAVQAGKDLCICRLFEMKSRRQSMNDVAKHQSKSND